MAREIIGSLPLDIAPFVGRDELLTMTTRVLRHARLVTLTGPGGVGKTRLALRVARRAAVDSAWVVDISAIAGQADHTPDGLYAHLALGLGIGHNGTAGLDTILEHLRGRAVLLILDNCDRLVGPLRELLRRLLMAAPQVRILATSRQALGVEGEHKILVPPLGADEAVALFVEHAVAAGADRVVVQPDPDVDPLCGRLDRLPLAIMLAAAWIPTLSVRELMTLADDRFVLLRDLEGAVALSYDLCSEDEQRLWTYACVFAGSFDLASITAVAANAGIYPAQVLDLVTGLVQKSVLTVDSTAGISRYHMLDTLREYGLRVLSRTGDDVRLRRLHCDHFREVAHQAATTWQCPHELDIMEAVHRHLPDLLAAVDYCVSEGELATARPILCDIVRSRAPFSYGFLGLIAQRLQSVIDTSVKHLAHAPIGNTESASEAVDIAATAALAGWIAVTVGRREDAERLINLAEDMLAAHGQGAIPPLLFAQGGYLVLGVGDSEGIGLLTAARALTVGAEFAGDREMATMVRAMGFAFVGTPQTAMPAAAEYLRQARQGQAPWDIAWAWWTCALAAFQAGDYKQATVWNTSCLRAFHEMDDQWGPPWAFELSAHIIAARLDQTDNPRAEARRSQWLLGAAQGRQNQLGVSLGGLAPFAALRTKTEESNSRHLDRVAMAAAFDQGNKAHRAAMGVAMGEPIPRGQRANAHPGSLSDRERQIVELVAAGLTSGEIGTQLHLATGTVNTHVKRILSKLGLHNRAALATWAAENLAS
jgi:predicted ATPase/DNA-binding CsgD family transcriptional regulator